VSKNLTPTFVLCFGLDRQRSSSACLSHWQGVVLPAFRAAVLGLTRSSSTATQWSLLEHGIIRSLFLSDLGSLLVFRCHLAQVIATHSSCSSSFMPGVALWLLSFFMPGVTNLARQAPWHWRRCHSHPCRPVARPRFRCRSRGHPPRLGALTDLRHIAPVVISPMAGRYRPLSFVSVMLLVRPFSCPLRLLSPID